MRVITRGASAGAGLIFHVFVQDSSSTSGAGKASIGFGSFSCRYIRNGEAISGAITPEDITTIGTYAAPTANTNIRIKAVDNTNMIGVYEVQIHADWVNTTNSCQSLTIMLTATGAAPVVLQIPLQAVNAQDSVRLGLTALPNAAADAAGGLPISDAGGLDLDAKLANTNEVTAARMGALTDWINGGRLDLILDDILADTAVIGAAGAGLSAIPWNALWDAEVQSEVQDAIEVNNLDHLVKAAVDTDFATTVHLDSVIGHLADAGGTATFDRTTDALEILGAATAPSAATIADAVWDEAIAGHAGVGSTGEALAAAGSAGDPWATALPGAYGAGTAGSRIGRIPDIAAGAANGLLIAGSNAATTFATLTVTNNMAVGGDFDVTGSISLGVGFEVAGGITVGGATTLAAVTATTIATSGTVTLNALTVSGATTLTGAVTGTNASNDLRLGATQNAATADKLLNRNINQGGDGTRTVEEALAFLRNKWSISGTTLTVTDVDDVTTLWTSTISTNASADPVTGSDPA